MATKIRNRRLFNAEGAAPADYRIPCRQVAASADRLGAPVNPPPKLARYQPQSSIPESLERARRGPRDRRGPRAAATDRGWCLWLQGAVIGHAALHRLVADS